MEHFDPTRHFQPRLHFHIRPDPKPSQPIRHRRPTHTLRLSTQRQRKRLHRKRSSHILGPTRINFPGGYEHEPDLVTRIEQLKRTIIVNKFIVVRVLNGDVLREGEVNGTVRGGERGELDGVDGDNGRFWFEKSEVKDEDDNEDEN